MKIKSLILLLLSFLFIQCSSDGELLIPKQDNAFVNVYRPSGDYFFGPDTEFLTEGKWYDEWVPNDHCFVKADDGLWHIFGITHPLVETSPLNIGIHDGENASFHAISTANGFKETLVEGHYADFSKVLTPKERPGEILANHAPYIIRKDGVYHMIYGHSPLRLAISSDLNDWQPQGKLFSDKDGARDPNILEYNGTFYVTYCSEKSVRISYSTDFKSWSDPVVILNTNKFDPESPSLIRHNNTFYLFVCSWDGYWDKKEIVGAYQHKTYVYQSDDLMDFGTDEETEITTLNAHAPEIFKDETGQWYISSVEWPKRGVSVDKLDWVKR